MWTLFHFHIPRLYSVGEISRTSQIGGESHPAQSLTRGKLALSSKSVLMPDFTRTEAQVLPAGPPPTMIASYVAMALIPVTIIRIIFTSSFFHGCHFFLSIF